MKVSVIIPVYNKEISISNTIDSVLNQTYENYEIIIVDDGSTDNTRKVLMRFEKKINIITQSNKGVSAARNKGIEESSGELISFLDADDLWDPYFLERMVDAIGNNDVCYCGHYYQDNKKKYKGKIKFTNKNVFVNYLANKTTPNTNSWMIRKDYIKNINARFIEGVSWGEDMLFFSTIISKTNSITYVSEFLTIYNIFSKGNLSENHIKKIELDEIWLNKELKIIENSVLNNINKEKAKKMVICYRFPGAIVYRLKNNMSSNEFFDYYKNYYDDMKEIKLINGIRSVKLIVNFMILKMRVRYLI